MDTETESSIIDSPDAMRALAEQADETRFAHGDQVDTTPESHEPATEPEAKSPEGKPDNSEADPAKERLRDPLTGKFVKGDGEEVVKPQSEAVANPTAAPESEYARKQRARKESEAARLDKTWENVNRQKEEIAREKERLAQERRQFQQPAQTPTQKREYTSTQMYEAHQDFRSKAKQALRDGDYDTFNEQSNLADKAMEHAGQFYQLEQQEKQQADQAKLVESWNGHMRQLIQDDPDGVGNPESPIAKEINSMLPTIGPKLRHVPDGFLMIADYAKQKLLAGSASELRETVKKQAARIAELERATGLSGGGVTSPPAKKSFENMDIDSMGKALRRSAEAAGLFEAL